MKNFVLVVAVTVVGQTAMTQSDVEIKPLTGNLRLDLLTNVRLEFQDSIPPAVPSPQRKSPLRAAAYSAVIPGAGEFYAESYWRSMAFFGAEVALWIVYATYDSKGDRQTAQFEQYADQYWSVVKYAQWIEDNYDQLAEPGSPPCPPIIIRSTGEPWERVDWAALNACEEIIGRRASTGFSHRLPVRPDQQYYELIGKYQQYNPGWEDFIGVPPDHLTSITMRFREYRDMRGRANDFYNVARTAGFVLVANHLLSALDAAWSAAQFNNSLRIEVHLEPRARPFGFVEFVPTARATISF